MNEGLKVLNGQSLSEFDSLQTTISNLLWHRISSGLDATILSTLISNASFIDYQLGDEIISISINPADLCVRLLSTGQKLEP